MNRFRALGAAIVLHLPLATPAFADGPVPFRAIAPDTTYVVVAADDVQRSVERWHRSQLQAFLETPPMRKVLGEDGGAQKAMQERLKELGVPEDSVGWPLAMGAGFFTVHDSELDVDRMAMIAYGDWGAKSEGVAKVIDAVIAESVRKDGVKTDKDEVGGREVQVLTLKSVEEPARRGRGGMGLDMEIGGPRSPEKVWYCHDGTRFLLSTEREGLEDALAALDGKRKSKLPEQADFRGAMDQLGEVDLAVAILTGPLQKAMSGEGQGMMALLQPMLQPLFGDVQAWTVGIGLDTPRGQLEVTSGILVPGKKAGLWGLLGPAAPPEAPPPMVGPDAIGLGRINVRFKDVVPLLNTVVSQLPQEQAQEIDAWLVNFGPVLSKGFEAMGPGAWNYDTVRQPVTPESRVNCTLIGCSNPKAVVPMVTQFGGTMGLEPRDVDGNTIFSGDLVPVSVGVSNGWMASGDPKLVEQAMRSMGQKDLPSVAETPAFKAASLAVGGDAVISWGYVDLAARWGFERELLERFGDDDSKLDDMVGKSAENSVARRLGYKVPKDADEVLKTIDSAMVAKYVGPMVWSMKGSDAGFVTRVTVLQPLAGGK